MSARLVLPWMTHTRCFILWEWQFQVGGKSEAMDSIHEFSWVITVELVYQPTDSDIGTDLKYA